MKAVWILLVWWTSFQHLAGQTVPVRFDAMVNSSESLFQALQDPSVALIGTSGFIELDSRTFPPGAVQLHRSVTVTSVAQRPAVWQVAHANAVITVGRNVTLRLESFTLEQVQQAASLPIALSANQDSLLWPTVHASAGESLPWLLPHAHGATHQAYSVGMAPHGLLSLLSEIRFNARSAFSVHPGPPY